MKIKLESNCDYKINPKFKNILGKIETIINQWALKFHDDGLKDLFFIYAYKIVFFKSQLK